MSFVVGYTHLLKQAMLPRFEGELGILEMTHIQGSYIHDVDVLPLACPAQLPLVLLWPLDERYCLSSRTGKGALASGKAG